MAMPMGLAGFVLLSLTLASQSASGLELGQRWQYKHEGPRPGSIEPNVIDGERIIWVVGQGPGAGDSQPSRCCRPTLCTPESCCADRACGGSGDWRSGPRANDTE